MMKQLIVGVNAMFDYLHTIVFQEEQSGGLRIVGESRKRDVLVQGDHHNQIDRILRSITEALQDANASADNIRTIGVSTAGQHDTVSGTIVYATNLAVQNFPLVATLQETIPCPIALVWDTDAYAIGEQKFGVGKNASNLIYCYVSYGMSASIILDNNLYKEVHKLAGEFGHTTVKYDGLLCDCGNYGCIEALASRKAITRRIQAAYKAGQKTVLADIEDLSQEPLDLNASTIAEAIEKRDAVTIQVIEDAAVALGAGVANLINLLNPEVVILGGDIIDNIDIYYEQATIAARARALRANLVNLSIARAALGTTAGAYGAAYKAKQYLERVQSGTSPRH